MSILDEIQKALKRTTAPRKVQPIFGPSPPVQGPRTITKAEYEVMVMSMARALAAPTMPNALHVNLAEQEVRRQLAAQGTTVMGKGSGVRRRHRRPTAVKRMLLVAAAAQVMAGPGKNPTKEQLARATRAVDAKISEETSVSGSYDVVGGFWDKVKGLAKSAGSAAVQLAPKAFGFVAKNPQVFLPLAGAAMASPFLIRAIAAASRSPQAQQEAATGPPPPPRGETVAVAVPADEEDVLGMCHSWDDRSGDGIVGEITEEEAALAQGGGSTERESMERLRGTSMMGGPAIPHDHYRAAILASAARLAGGRPPETRHFYMAKKSMDRAFKRRGASVSIPGARPSRRTR